MTLFTERERSTLEAVCRTLVPRLEGVGEPGSGLVAIGADEVRLARSFEEAIGEITTEEERRPLRLFLRLLSQPLVNGLLSGRWHSFSDLPAEAQTEVLLDWMQSRVGPRRQAFQAVKRLALFLFYSDRPEGKDHPAWAQIGYQPAPAVERSERRLSTISPTGEERLEAEILVVGSGAGGSVVAAELAAAGHDVLVVEKGGHFEAPDFHGLELSANAELFEKGGALTTDDLGVVVLAGSALGGGTVVNWSTSLETPANIRQEWARAYGFVGVEGPSYDRSLQAVQERLHVNLDESEPNRQNEILARGAASVGHEVKVVPRNVEGCVDCSYCGFGCRYRAKQSTLETYLADAQRKGARLMTETAVRRIRVEAGRAVGAEIERQRAGRPVSMRVLAKAVVVCAGAIHTPALLRRSGLKNENIGRHLRLHPVTAPVGVYEAPVRSWQGPPQTRMVEALADLDGTGYGVRLEVAPAHPGLWASALPWTSGRDHKRLMSELAHLANLIVICRDQGSGRVKLDRAGEPVLEYRLAPKDADRLRRGMLEALRLHRAAGARQIFSPHVEPRVYQAGSGSFERFLEEAAAKSMGPNRIALFSAHQMGSCRIAGWRRRGAIRPSGESWEVRNLFVADGSVFPTAPGVNPMISIAATAHLLSERILTHL